MPIGTKSVLRRKRQKAMHNQGGYEGWGAARVSPLITDLIKALGHGERADPLALTCSVNLEDYRKSKSLIPRLRSPEAICLDVCFGSAIRHPDRDSGVELYFDRHENFYPILKKAWKLEARDKRFWWAQYVSKITEIDDMRDEPEIQAADFLAWLANRYNTHDSCDRWGRLFFSTFLAKKHYHQCVDYDALMALFDSDGAMRDNVQLPPARIRAPFLKSSEE